MATTEFEETYETERRGDTRYEYRETGYAEEQRPPLTVLLRKLRDEAMLLARQEAALARTEVGEKVDRIGRNIGYMAAGGLVLFAGFLVLLASATAGVYLAFAAAEMAATGLWAAPLIVGGIVAVVGLLLVLKAKSTLSKESAMPEKTVQSLKEDKQWAANKI